MDRGEPGGEPTRDCGAEVTWLSSSKQIKVALSELAWLLVFGCG